MNIEAHCHCNRIAFKIPTPVEVGICNCSICRRNGANWAYFSPDDVRLVRGELDVVPYEWGAKTLTIYHCRYCGCTTHWTSKKKESRRMGVNARLADAIDLDAIPKRLINGASF